jgi:hypothetical protein
LNRAVNQRISFLTNRHEFIREKNKLALCLSTISILLLFLASCVPQSSRLAATGKINDEERAQQALMDFLGNLHNGKYAEAARYYGGSYETMIDHNPDIDPNDHAALMRNACTINGMQCLQAKIIGLEDKVPGEKYVFMIEFLKEDGTPFMLGPCCGGEESNFPPQSVFHFSVMEVDQNKSVVMDMPPYIP